MQIKQIHEFDKNKGDERINKGNDKKTNKQYIKKNNKLNLIYNSNRSCHRYYNINKLDNLSF